MSRPWSTPDRCPSEVEFLDITEGRASSAAIARLHEHANRCSPCRRLLAALLRADRAEASPPPRYRLDAVLGRGAMGTAYRAFDRDGRPVVLKLLHPALLDNREALERFRREAAMAATLSNPHIAPIIETGEHESQPYLAMPFYEGETLRQRLERGRLSVVEVCTLLRQMADGVAAAHAAGVVHRDLKPSNLFLTTDHVLKILDFGLAKTTSMSDTSLTTTGAVLGTLAYMAPEQLRGEPADTRADLWSMGVIAYEMATGVSPFRAGRPESIIGRVLQGQIRPASEIRPELPRSLVRLISSLLTRELDRRPSSAERVSAALTRMMPRTRTPAAAPAPSAVAAANDGSAKRADRLDADPISGFELPRGRAHLVVALMLLTAVTAVLASYAWRLRASAGQPSAAAVAPAVDHGSAWFTVSPDGSKVAFVSPGDSAESRVFVAAVEGGVPRAVTPAGYSEPEWNRDGRSLVINGPNGTVWRVNIDGSGLEPFANDPSSNEAPLDSVQSKP